MIFNSMSPFVAVKTKLLIRSRASVRLTKRGIRFPLTYFFLIILLPTILWATGGRGKNQAGPDLYSKLYMSIRDTTAIDRRIMMEEKTEGNPFAITPYKPIYMIPVVFSTNPNNEEYRRFSSNASLNNVEVQFQLSFKLLLWRRIFGHKADLYLAYTQLSLWQAYNLELSSPFRETNYEPEFILRSALNTKILGAKLRFVSLALNHQSNGRNAPLSRSWNRIISSMAMEKGHFYWNLRVWVRVLNDGNPDMLEYLGNGDLLLVFVPHKRSKQAISVFFRPNMRSNFRGALQVEWTFPLGINHLKAYVQFFTGYGQSMIDYNHKQTRIGAGIMLTNWL